jgi:hypothetical protein
MINYTHNRTYANGGIQHVTLGNMIPQLDYCMYLTVQIENVLQLMADGPRNTDVGNYIVYLASNWGPYQTPPHKVPLL